MYSKRLKGASFFGIFPAGEQTGDEPVDFSNRCDVKAFRFTGFFFDGQTRTAHLHYAFDDAVHFEETIEFCGAGKLDPDREAALKACLRLLHLAAGVSYYKAYVPAEMKVETGALTPDEAAFFDLFYKSGLGEFSYRNNIVPPVRFPFSETEQSRKPFSVRLPPRTAVPVGGGKDSVVTLETLKRSGRTPVLFSVGTPRPIRETIEVSGLPSIKVLRKISPVLTELNANAQRCGALNGHVPVTGIIAFILAAAAVLYDFSDVAMSNERSANVGNTMMNGVMVNHQWSKSIEFEKAFTGLMQGVLPDFRYFSLLRPLSELSIARLFCNMEKYDSVFTSCNRAFRLDETKRLDRWCGDCDKCRFVFLALAPFAGKRRVTSMFGSDPLDDAGQIEGFRQLLGLSAFKPFECVGEIEESVWSFLRICRAPEWKNDAVVAALRENVEEKWKSRESELAATIFSLSDEHLIPKEYADVVGYFKG